jgi:hypothetical protein
MNTVIESISKHHLWITKDYEQKSDKLAGFLEKTSCVCWHLDAPFLGKSRVFELLKRPGGMKISAGQNNQ